MTTKGTHMAKKTRKTSGPSKTKTDPRDRIIDTALTLAAERGWRGISSNYVQPFWVATHLPKFLEGQRNIGQPEDPSRWSIAKSIFVAFF